ncbi:GNAT family N-acetyltransferase [Halomonas organivorans]
MNVRDARKDDARDLAYLINLAGEGMPEYLWRRMAGEGESPMAVGIERAGREEGGFSYRHARVCVHRGRVLGMILDYRLPDPYDLAALADCPSVVRPLVRLEARVPGSWYINAIATCPDARGKGVARLLMAQAEASAIAAGCETLSLIVASENRPARRLYDRQGFDEIASLPVIAYPGCRHGGEWQLMTRALDTG